MASLKEHYESYLGEWESLQELRDAWEYQIPEQFNGGEFLCDRWASDKSNVALFYEDWTTDSVGTYTFWELKRLTNQLANCYHEYGLEKGDRLAVNVSRKREALLSYLAAWKAGLVPVPLSTLFGSEGLEYRIEDSGARLGVVDASNLDAYREATADNDAVKTSLIVGDATPQDREIDFWEALGAESPEYEVAETSPEDDFILMYTSGTTGEPKGVRHAHRSVFGHFPGMLVTGFNLEINDGEVFWTPVEFSWAGTLTTIVGAWSFGIAMVAFESGESFDGDRAFSVIDRYDVTAASIPASGLRMMTQVEDPSERYDIDQMRQLVSGGESLGKSIRNWAGDVFDAPVHEVYGQTEIWNMVVGDCTKLSEPRPEWMGRHLPGHELEIVDPETAEVLEPGELGEIAVHRDDPAVLKEYWNKPEKTEQKFNGDWVLTGDIGRRDEDGWIKFVSRKDDVIISSGYRISPVEVEDSVAAHEAVATAGVIGVPDDERGTVVKAYVVLVEDAEPSNVLKKEIQDHVRDNLAAYEYPRHVEFVESLPRTTTGKVKRSSLREKEKPE